MADEGLGEEVERAIDELYAADPAGFTAARTRLAGELRRAGQRDEAIRVAGLRRPTLAAWAVDHLALRAPERIDSLVAAGERLRQAQEEAVSGGDPTLLHRAGEERRALIAVLATEALDAVRARGGDSAAHREEVEATLEAASSDPEVASLTRRGRLVTAVPRPAGFAGLLDLPLGQAAARARPAPTAAEEAEHGPRPEDDLEQAREAVRRRQQAAADAAAEADEARAAADEAVAAVARLETELAEARALAAAAKEQARLARERREAARRDADAAVRRLDRRDPGSAGP